MPSLSEPVDQVTISASLGEVVPCQHAQPPGSNKDGTCKDQPLLAHRKRALCQASSDQLLQEDELQSSQDMESPDEDLLSLNNNEIAQMFNNETVQWDGTTIWGTPTQSTHRADRAQEAGYNAGYSPEHSDSEAGTLTDEIKVELTQHRHSSTVEAATKVDRGEYRWWVQTDPVLQRTVSDLLLTHVSLYQTNIKYDLKYGKTEQEVQVARLLTNDIFIFEL
ncbi:hypothetical protein EI94DRAFT_1701853 [Lactarius quietus]|nr:hypothetical protein EI94DRAFT_1701853 [Lactarius quietus]